MERFAARRVSNGWLVEWKKGPLDPVPTEMVIPVADPALAIENFARFLGAEGHWTRSGRDAGTPLGRLIEEAGEMLAAAGKTARYGPDSYNPEPGASKETNAEWLMREIADLEESIAKIKRMAPQHWLRDERTPMVGR